MTHATKFASNERRAGYWDAMSLVSDILERLEYRESDRPDVLEAIYDVRAALAEHAFEVEASAAA
ncbi:hypothetical protein [Mangrovibrevibacter kandeliae]|uniref:hypothetical protein n=1 Tax=Mangrovibrevibacter kandeliae TaxID=2968473 RepID=UPI002117BD83|nr:MULTISPECIES: hypothetical protein [unclassified Aurantimonas]MCQ8784041.1 hypothetical protein [Aurantimonas sp. CSK15Z-1]MCW4116758.1 hypothetical protein [Aurantimonas sp. MSK8Z-1]